jgi:hypothetical protein
MQAAVITQAEDCSRFAEHWQAPGRRHGARHSTQFKLETRSGMKILDIAEHAGYRTAEGMRETSKADGSTCDSGPGLFKKEVLSAGSFCIYHRV